MKCLVTIVLCTVLCLSGSQAAFAQDLGATESDTITEYRWVGLTTTTTDGSIQAEFGALEGHSAMHQMCANEVALNARACFTSEIVRSVVQGSRIRNGWVIPTGHLLHYDPTPPRVRAGLARIPPRALRARRLRMRPMRLVPSVVAAFSTTRRVRPAASSPAQLACYKRAARPDMRSPAVLP